MSRLLPLFASMALALTTAACGGDDASGDPLTCESLTLCTYAEVTTYHGTLAASTGGAIVDGQYRLAWIVTEHADDDGRLEDLEAIEIRGGHFRRSGSPRGDLGTITTSGTEATLASTTYCDLSVDAGEAAASWTYGYSASAGELRLRDTVRSSDGTSWQVEYVYKRMGAADELCALTSSVPSSAGESAHCWASNCFCSYAVNTEITASACPF